MSYGMVSKDLKKRWAILQETAGQCWHDGDHERSIKLLISSIFSGNFPDIPSLLNRHVTRSRVEYIMLFIEEFIGFEHADIFFNRAIGIFPEIRIIRIANALILSSQGKTRAAVKAITEAISMHYDDLYAQDLLIELSSSKCLNNKKKKPEADLKECFCEIPFDSLKIFQGGHTFQCCPNWLPFSIGNVFNDSWTDVWNSVAAKEIRRSILDGDFSYCSKLSCPRIQEGLPKIIDITNPRHRKIIDTRDINQNPISLNLSYDHTCNLSCPSCRPSIQSVSLHETIIFNDFFEKSLVNLLHNVKSVFMCSSGDPFASKHYGFVFNRMKLMGDEMPALEIQTNAVLLTQERWKDLGTLVHHISRIEVSIDSATPETYQNVRRGGDFVRLIKNMEFLASQKKKIGFSLQLDFCVQEENFLEMKQYVELGKQWGADTIYFSRLRNWGTYPEGEYLSRAIANQTHPRHKEFVEFIQDDIFDNTIVSLGDLLELRRDQ